MTQDDSSPSFTDSRPDSAPDLTIKDIARMAGVSISTVSRVINDTGLVTLPKLKAVKDVLARVNYIPNNSARALVKRRTMTVGLIVPTLANPIFAPTVAGIEETLERAGYGLLISCSHRSPDRELAQARTMVARGVEGIVLTGSYRHPELLPLMAARNVAIVSQDDPAGAPDLVSIAMPDSAAMACAIDALVSRGHRRIGIVTGPTDNTRAIADRVRGAQERLKRYGLLARSGDLQETPDYTADAAREAASRLLTASSDVTGIACTGDILAIGVISHCRAEGRRVPDDISVVGCGQTVMAQFADPKLTTVRLSFRHLGELAALNLLHLLDRHPDAPVNDLTFELVEGGTITQIR